MESGWVVLIPLAATREHIRDQNANTIHMNKNDNKNKEDLKFLNESQILLLPIYSVKVSTGIHIYICIITFLSFVKGY